MSCRRQTSRAPAEDCRRLETCDALIARSTRLLRLSVTRASVAFSARSWQRRRSRRRDVTAHHVLTDISERRNQIWVRRLIELRTSARLVWLERAGWCRRGRHRSSQAAAGQQVCAECERCELAIEGRQKARTFSRSPRPAPRTARLHQKEARFRQGSD